MRGNGSVFSITQKIKDKRLERSWGGGERKRPKGEGNEVRLCTVVMER
jgi:hypothetical protein